MNHPIGIMQGRLVPPVGNSIQAFPSHNWRSEFPAAQVAGIAAIEWIYDVGEEENPICTEAGVSEIQTLSQRHDVAVRSVCADYFMTERLLRGTNEERQARINALETLLRRCSSLGIKHVVLPFVDASKLENSDDIESLAELLRSVFENEDAPQVEIHLETALDPSAFAALLDLVKDDRVKVNYDSGNSASLGFDADQEFAAYGHRIGSVHIKDRLLNGGTVPLGTGNVDFPKLARNLKSVRYCGSYVLQVARGVAGEEVAWATQNRNFLERLLEG